MRNSEHITDYGTITTNDQGPSHLQQTQAQVCNEVQRMRLNEVQREVQRMRNEIEQIQERDPTLAQLDGRSDALQQGARYTTRF